MTGFVPREVDFFNAILFNVASLAGQKRLLVDYNVRDCDLRIFCLYLYLYLYCSCTCGVAMCPRPRMDDASVLPRLRLLPSLIIITCAVGVPRDCAGKGGFGVCRSVAASSGRLCD